MVGKNLAIRTSFVALGYPIYTTFVFSTVAISLYSSVPHVGNTDLRHTDPDIQNDTLFYKKLVKV